MKQVFRADLERLKALMVDCDLTQAELSRRIDADKNTISHWVTGKHRVPGSVLAYLELLATVKAACD
jgi:transcriptional regulator with XRE-family HTH domain